MLPHFWPAALSAVCANLQPTGYMLIASYQEEGALECCQA